MKRTIAVFSCSEEEWVAASSARSALKFYLGETGIDFKFDMEGEMPKEVCDSEMERLKFIEESDESHDPAVGTHKSFKVKLAELVKEKQKFPCWFAVTDY